MAKDKPMKLENAIQEAKDKVAVSFGYDRWERKIYENGPEFIENAYDKVLDILLINRTYHCEGLNNAMQTIQERYHYDITRVIGFHWREIATEYARSKWYEACEAQKELSSEYSGEQDYAPNPDFIP